MRGLLQGAAIYTLSNVASAAVPFLLLPALTRALSPGEYGEVAMFATLVTIASAVVGLSAHGSAAVRYYQRDTTDFSVYVSSCLAVMAASFVAVMAVLLGVTALVPNATGLPVRWALAAVAVAAMGFVLQMRLVVWLAQKRALQYAGLQLAYALSNAGLTVVLVLVVDGAAAGRMGAQALATGLAAALAVLSLWRSGMLAARISWPYMKEAARFGAPLVPHLLGTTVVVTFDRFVIKEQQGLAETGVYMVAVQIALVIALMADAVNKAFVPWLYENLAAGRSDFPMRMVKRTWLCFGGIALLALGAIVAVEPLVRLVAGERFAAASTVLPWLIGGQALGAAYYLVVNYIFYSKRTQYLAVASLSCGAVNVLLTLMLVPRLGIAGAGVSFCVAQGLLLVLVWWFANRVHPMPWLFWRHKAT